MKQELEELKINMGNSLQKEWKALKQAWVFITH